MQTVHGHAVRGVDVGPETRCAHYDSARDVVAMRFPCCERYYPCFDCHAVVADHEPARWDADDADREAVLCGVCGHELTVRTYLTADDSCPACDAAFNPGCRNHAHLYFAASLVE